MTVQRLKQVRNAIQAVKSRSTSSVRKEKKKKREKEKSKVESRNSEGRLIETKRNQQREEKAEEDGLKKGNEKRRQGTWTEEKAG